MNPPLLRSEISEAEHQLGLAQADLALAVQAIDTLPRAEKTIPSSLVEGALDRVKLSRDRLGELLRSLPEHSP